ncbi:hypothetical protein KDL01_12980 [Actinospica durhamensis]|uniref:Secreted protein n=1 Tax=Actinospica durhamensis TaxID=1508375 RepID=A0A941EM34_9ACTN|nr:hypothetical protein [Actinospica durhamensis]MBR7834182.1 hypothetical protein [Actinospica durhamensis]
MRRITAVAVTLAAAGAIATFSTGAASAATGNCPDGHGGCSEPGWYTVSGSTGNLAVQNTDGVNNVIGGIPNGAPVGVLCQRNNGSTDPYDGLYSKTWDYVEAYFNGGWNYGWVYDHYVTTAAQDSNGWSVTVVCGFTNNPG